MSPDKSSIIVCKDKEAISRHVAQLFVTLAEQALSEQRPFSVALAGGSTPATLYSILASPEFLTKINWDNIHLFPGDERFVPVSSSDSNTRMITETLLTNIPLPAQNFHTLDFDQRDAEAAALKYEQVLASFFQTDNTMPCFDLILLGMGPDGHCASLFPHKPALLEQTKTAVASEPGLKPFVPRVTLTFPVINNARNVVFLVSGEDKAETLQRVLEGEQDTDSLPSQSVHPIRGSLYWVTDEAAASRLARS